MTVGEFLRAVPAMSDEDLRAAITCPDFDGDATAHAGMADSALAELLRRKQEQCAKECESDEHGPGPESYACANRVRDLK